MKINLKKIIEWGLYLWVFLLPWQARWLAVPQFVNNEFWEYGSISIYATEVLAVCILLLFFVFITLQKKWPHLFHSFQSVFLDKKITTKKILLLLLLWLVISNLWSVDVLVSWTRLAHIILIVSIVGIMSYLFISSRRLLVVLLGAGIVQGWLAIDQFLSQKVIGSAWLGMSAQLPDVFGVSVIQYEAQRWLRAYGSLPHPNILGSFLVVVLFALVYFFIKVRNGDFIFKKIDPRLYLLSLYGSLFFIFSGILLSFSRAAWLASFIGLFIILVFVYKRYRDLLPFLFKIYFVLFSVFLFWFMISPLPFFTRFQGAQPLEKQSYEERIQSYTDSEYVTKNYWLQGSGFGTYTSVLIKQNPNRKMSLQQPVHNTWLLVLNEIGIVGFVLFVSLFVFIYKEADNKYTALLFLLPVVVLMFFDHFWVSLVFGNVWLVLILYLVRKAF